MVTKRELDKRLYLKECLDLEKKIKKLCKSLESHDEKKQKLMLLKSDLERELEELKILEGSYK